VQHIDRIFKLRHIQHAEDTRFIFDPNLLHSGSNYAYPVDTHTHKI
jgi:hypothetical protein